MTCLPGHCSGESQRCIAKIERSISTLNVKQHINLFEILRSYVGTISLMLLQTLLFASEAKIKEKKHSLKLSEEVRAMD